MNCTLNIREFSLKITRELLSVRMHVTAFAFSSRFDITKRRAAFLVWQLNELIKTLAISGDKIFMIFSLAMLLPSDKCAINSNRSALRVTSLARDKYYTYSFNNA